MARSNPPMEGSFVAELTRRLQGQGPSLVLPLTWIEQRLSETGWTIQKMVQSENQTQAASQVSMSNSIGSLRYLSALDWRKFLESMSVVEQTLREDPGLRCMAGWELRRATGTGTRSREDRPSYGKSFEHEIARKAMEQTKASLAAKGAEDRAAHVGFYLIGEGRGQLENAVSAKLPTGAKVRRAGRRSPMFVYVGGILLITLLFAAGLAAKAYGSPVELWVVGAVAVISMVAASQLAVALVNWAATLLARAAMLHRAWISSAGIPAKGAHPGS